MRVDLAAQIREYVLYLRTKSEINLLPVHDRYTRAISRSTKHMSIDYQVYFSRCLFIDVCVCIYVFAEDMKQGHAAIAVKFTEDMKLDMKKVNFPLNSIIKQQSVNMLNSYLKKNAKCTMHQKDADLLTVQ